MTFVKDGIPWNKGVPHSEETKRKISAAHEAVPLSKDHKRRISESLKGKKKPPWSDERREKQSLALVGKRISPNTEFKKGQVSPNKGKRCPWAKFPRLKGEKNHNWKGGIAPERVKIRNSIISRLWREEVFFRDNWTCQKCRIRSGNGKAIYLVAHHIQNFAEYPEIRFSVENGITLCKDCHKEIHKNKARASLTKG